MTLFLQRAWYLYFFWKHLARCYFFRKKWSASSFLQKKIKHIIISSKQNEHLFWSHNKALYFFQQKCRNHAYWKKTHAPLIISLETNEVPRYFIRKQISTSLFLQKKISIFFWRNKEALDFFSRNTETMLTEEKNMHAESFLQKKPTKCFIITSEKIQRHIISSAQNWAHCYFFRKKCRASSFLQKKIQCLIISSKKMSFFSE